MKPAAGVPRKKEYKKGVDADDARRKREDNIIELRKNKRDENLQKKRMVNAGPSYAMEDSSSRTGMGQNKVGLAGIAFPCVQVQWFVQVLVAGGAPHARDVCFPSSSRPWHLSLTLITTGVSWLQQLDELPAKVKGLYSQQPNEQYEATQWFRKLLSIGAI